MARIIKNQTRNDFLRRVGRIDPAYSGTQILKPVQPRSFAATLMGFIWAFGVILVAQNRTALESAISPALRDSILMATAAALLASITMFGVHFVRMLLRKGPARTNSRALLLGAALAMALTHMPTEISSAGFALLGQDAQSMLLAAGNGVGQRLPGVDFSAAVSVSSWGL